MKNLLLFTVCFLFSSLSFAKVNFNCLDKANDVIEWISRTADLSKDEFNRVSTKSLTRIGNKVVLERKSGGLLVFDQEGESQPVLVNSELKKCLPKATRQKLPQFLKYYLEKTVPEVLAATSGKDDAEIRPGVTYRTFRRGIITRAVAASRNCQKSTGLDMEVIKGLE